MKIERAVESKSVKTFDSKRVKVDTEVVRESSHTVPLRGAIV